MVREDYKFPDYLNIGLEREHWCVFTAALLRELFTSNLFHFLQR